MATLLEAGASPEFVQLANHPTEGRNSVLENAQRALSRIEKTDYDPAGSFGHFGDYMWKGNLYKAFERADARNTRLMLEVFGLDYINAKSKAIGRDGFKENENGRYVYR